MMTLGRHFLDCYGKDIFEDYIPYVKSVTHPEYKFWEYITFAVILSRRTLNR